MTLERSIFKGGSVLETFGLSSQSLEVGSQIQKVWIYDTTLATLGLLIPAITSATNYWVRAIAQIGANAGGGDLTFFGDDNPDDLRFAVTSTRQWSVDFRNKSFLTNPGDVVDETTYLIEVLVNDKTFEAFIDGQSIGSDTASQRVTLLDLGLCGRHTGGDTDQKTRGQMFVFEVEDLDTPANTKTWKFTQTQSLQPQSNELTDQNGQNPLTQVNEPVSSNWTETQDTIPEL